MDPKVLEEKTKLLIERPAELLKRRHQVDVSHPMGALLLRHGLISEESLEVALKHVRTDDLTLDQAIVRHGTCSEQQLASVLAKALELEAIDPKSVRPETEYLMRLSQAYAEEHACLPVRPDKDRLLVLVADPTDPQLQSDVSSMTGEELLVAVAPRTALAEAITAAYSRSRTQIAEAEAMRQELQGQMEQVEQTGARSRSYSIVSNKGGVGKTHTAINLACAFAQMGSRTLVIDADMGNADISHKLNLSPESTLADFLDKKAEIEDTILETRYGFHLVPGKTGEIRLANLKYFQRLRFMKGFARVSSSYDTILYDLGAGVSLQVLDFALCADEMIVVTTPRDLVSGYACTKLAFLRHIELDTRLAGKERSHQAKRVFQPWFLINQVESPDEAQSCGQGLTNAAQLCMLSEKSVADSGYELSPLMLGGILSDSGSYVQAEKLRQTLYQTAPTHPNIGYYRAIARNLVNRAAYLGRGESNLARVAEVVSGAEGKN